MKLYMTRDHHAYEWGHIPGSIKPDNLAEAVADLSPEQEIVVYCSNPVCSSSFYAYNMLRNLGCKNVYRYDGGLMAWQDAGFELEGSRVN